MVNQDDLAESQQTDQNLPRRVHDTAPYPCSRPQDRLPHKLDSIIEKIDKMNMCNSMSGGPLASGEKGVNMLTYIAVNAAGDKRTNTDGSSVTAVTWGVFPGREILQPTVVDPVSFMVWKDEAFDLWTSEWGSLYAGDSEDDKKSMDVLKQVQQNYYLVSLVDNDFINGDIFKLFY